MKNIYYYLPAKVYFERGGVEKYLPRLKNYGSKALIVTGKKFVFETGLLDRIKKILDENGMSYAVCPKAEPEPPVENVEEGANFCRKEKCDVILAVGGGSAMDVGKAIAVLTANSGSLRKYFGEMEYENEPLPVIAVPTTCGTGSEVTRYAVIVDKEGGTKKTVRSEKIIPKIAILDSEILKSLPSKLVSATGMDAFSHSVESFLSKKATYLTKMFAFESIKLLWKFLPKANDNQDNLDFKEEVFLGSLLAGFAINHTGTIMVHGMGYSLTIKQGIHHGTANALLMPYVLEYLRQNEYEDEIKELEKIYGSSENLLNFIRGIGLPVKLSEVGVEESELENLSELCELGCQRAVKNMKVTPSKNDYFNILKKSLLPKIK